MRRGFEGGWRRSGAAQKHSESYLGGEAHSRVEVTSLLEA